MSVYRRMLIMLALLDTGSLIFDFTSGVVTLNQEGRGNKITVSNGEVTLNE